MKIKLLTGAAGTGKTTAMRAEIKRLAEKGEKTLLFVPDQFSFETERTLYGDIGARSIANAAVTSFARVSRKILTEYRLVKPYADDVVKLVTMQSAIARLSDSLTFYKKQSEKPSFPSYALRAVASFKNAGLTAQSLREILSEKITSGALFEKLSDLSMLFGEYDEMLTKTLDDKLDDVSRAAEAASRRGFFHGKRVFFDNFDSFSGTQQKLLKVIFEQAESVEICLTTDAEKSSERHFSCINKTIEQLKALAPEAESELFKTPLRSRNMDALPLAVTSAQTPYAEARYIAAEARRLAQEENARWRDILILTADRSYNEVIKAALQQYEIPFFSDFPEPLTGKPAVCFIISILKALSLETEDLLRYFKSGFVRISKDGKTRPLKAYEVSRLEKAAKRYHFKKDDWLSPFERTELKSIEALRGELVGELCELKSALENSENGAEATGLLVDFLLKNQDYKATLMARSKAGGGEGTDFLETDKAAADEYGRIWDDLVCVFDSLAFCLAEKKVTAEAFTLMLEAVFSGMTLANPPRTLDTVTIGDIERTRKASPRYVFICGANEGEIPRRSPPNPSFTAAEQEELEKNGLEIGGTRLFRYGKELFFTYRALSAAEKRLYITYPLQGFSGAEKAPSAFIKTLGAPVTRAENLPVSFYARTAASVRALLAAHYGDETGEALKKLVPDDLYLARLDTANAFAGGKGYDFSLSPETAGAVFASPSYSPTKLQTAFECAFTHFCKYGLGLFDDEPQDTGSPRLVGTEVHSVLMRVMRAENFFELSDAQTTELINQALEALKPRVREETGADEARIEAHFEQLLPRLEKLIMQTRLELSDTGFRPAFFEKKVTYKLVFPSDRNAPPLDDGKSGIIVGGTADRIDRLEADEKHYARICDYKTGKKEIDFGALMSGLDLQLFLYLFAYCDESGDLPAVAQYIAAGAEAPLKCSSTAAYSDCAQAKNWYSSHKASAALIKNDEAAAVENGFAAHNAQLQALTGSTKAAYIKSEEMSGKELQGLRSYIENELIIPKIEKLQKGKIPAVPTAKGEKSPCDFCRFKYFCNNKNGVFKTERTSASTFYEKISAEAQKSEGGEE